MIYLVMHPATGRRFLDVTNKMIIIKMVVLIIIGIIAYFVIGRIVAEKKWEWDGYDIYGYDQNVVLVTIFWLMYLMWKGIELLASIFVDI
jgi:hypothetical protein